MTAWDRKGFDAFEAGLPKERLRLDKLQLQSVFNMAAHVPILKQALVWAKKNDIKFFVDHTCKRIGGYYVDGAGIAAIAQGSLSFLPQAVGVIVHEVGHAWHDKGGMLPSDEQTFPKNYTNLSLVEAHARALQKRAEVETALVIPHMEGTLLLRIQEDRSLWQYYTQWFKGKLPIIYGTTASLQRGHQLGLSDVFPEALAYEFPGALEPGYAQGGIDISDKKDIWRLSSDFDGNPFFSARTAPEFIEYVTDPQIALRFYQEDWYAPTNLVQRVIATEFERRIKGPQG